jgi:hypothetical protein
VYLKTLLLFVFITSIAHGQSDDKSDRINFITTDADAFWKYFDAFKQDTTSNPFTEYLTGGTEAFCEFQEHRIRNAVSFKKVVRTELAYYDSVRSSKDMLLRYEHRIQQYFKNFKTIYPTALKPSVYVVIGQLNTGTTSTTQGVVIGMERYAEKTYSLQAGGTATAIEKLPLHIAMGIIFYNQRPAHTGYTLLRQCIIQGSAEFLMSLIVSPEEKDQILSLAHHTYGNAHEELLAKEFLLKKDSDDFSGWLYQNTESHQHPADLGFWIGYKITEAYYNSVADKEKAIGDILKINDFDRFLLLSGYLEPFKN